MDAFYASVEQRDRPELRGKPVVVGGEPKSRGVVCTASYEARVFGIHSAMPCAQAYRLCRDAIFVRPDFEKYARVSRQVREIFHSYTDLVEPLSLDEAYLDVTENKADIPSATWVAQAIRDDVRRVTDLTCSAGVGPNKFVAKVASDLNKPDGLVVVPPERVAEFVRGLPVRKVPGIGPVTERECKRRGIATCGDFLDFDERQLTAWFGRAGRHFLRLARGVDNRPVEPDQERKSCSIEDTFPSDVGDPAQVDRILVELAERLAERMHRHGIHGRTVTLKVRYGDFSQVTRSRTLSDFVQSKGDLLSIARELLQRTAAGQRPVRLLGIGVAQLVEGVPQRQLRLPFDGGAD